MNVQSTTLPDPPVSYETENDISPDRRSELVTLMNQRLADAVDLQLQMKQAHWNVKGPNFIALHHLFDEVEADVRDYVDLIAERVVQLGGTAEGTVRISASCCARHVSVLRGATVKCSSTLGNAIASVRHRSRQTTSRLAWSIVISIR